MYQKSPKAEKPSKTEAIIRNFENLQSKSSQTHAKSEKGRIFKSLKHPKLKTHIPNFGFLSASPQKFKKRYE